MKKRIISIILVTLLMVTSLPSFAKAASTPVPEYVSQLLESLGIMSSTEANIDREVQRNYVAQVLLNLSKLDNGTATGTYYTDVPAESVNAYAIEKMTELGYFRGVGGGLFNPDGYIAVNDMARLLLQYAGYGVALSNPAVTSAAYKNVGVSGYATYRDLAHMIFNVLCMDAMNITEFTQTGSSFEINKDVTVMADLFNVYEVKGTVIENDLTGLWGDSTLIENHFKLETTNGKLLLDTGKTDADSNIGKHITVFYQYDREMGTRKVLSYNVERASSVYELDLSVFDFASSTENELKYKEGKVKKEVRYNSMTSVIYNGTFYTDAGFSFENLTGLDGSITVIDNNLDKVADVFVITAYKTYVVKSVVLSDGRVFSKNTDEVVVLNEEKYDKYSLSNMGGKKAYLEDFMPGVVISVAQNATTSEKKVLKAYVAEEKVEGKATSVYDEDGRRFLEMGGETYELLPDVEVPDLGKQITAYINPFGKIAAINAGLSSEFLFGLITGVSIDAKEQNLKIKLLNTDSEYVEYVVAENVKYDGEKIKSYKTVYDKIASVPALKVNDGTFEKGIFPIHYELNAEGKISLIDTSSVGANEDKLSSMTKMDAAPSSTLMGDYVLGAEVATKADTPVFAVSGPIVNGAITYDIINNDTYTSCNVISDYSPPRSFSYAAYTMNAEKKYADFILTHTNSTDWDAGKDDSILIIDKISYVYDEDLEMMLPKVEGYEAGIKRSVVVSAESVENFNSLDLKQGDGIRYTTAAGKMTRVENNRPTISHYEDGFQIRAIREAEHELDRLKTGYDNFYLIYGYVLEREGDIMTIAFKSPGAYASGVNSGTKLPGTRSNEELSGAKAVVKLPANVAVTVYDPTREDEKVFAGTYDEILDYDSVGEECSFVALRYRNYVLSDIVVLNNSSLYR